MSNIKPETTIKFINPATVNADYTAKLEGFVKAGFPSPANDYIEKELNFRELFLRNESATFFVEVSGSSMIDAGIYDGDILVVDKSLNPCHNSILVCYIDGEFTVKRVQKIDSALYLIPDNKKFKPIKIEEHSDLRLWGVVTFAIHKFR
ncbi:MAG: translesion error-prone DNA polymerase V autoproteolytic subunit [Bacteroidales bacterium]|nr:translesion error-prone DNA polymerase V autoproteolytic subunit [Bacteroidales bacterium]